MVYWVYVSHGKKESWHLPAADHHTLTPVSLGEEEFVLCLHLWLASGQRYVTSLPAL